MADKITEKNCLLLGSGKDVWREFNDAAALVGLAGLKYEIMAINFTMVGLSHAHKEGHIKVTHWASLHRYYFALRPHLAPGVATHSPRGTQEEGVDYAYPGILNTGGSGGLWATKLALLMGYRKVILCGVPINGEPRFYDYGGAEQHFDTTSCRHPWIEAIRLDQLPTKRVRSMSGWTKDRLGEPSIEWLKD